MQDTGEELLKTKNRLSDVYEHASPCSVDEENRTSDKLIKI